MASTYALLDLDGPAADRAPAPVPAAPAPGDLQNCFWRRWQQWSETRDGGHRRLPPRH